MGGQKRLPKGRFMLSAKGQSVIEVEEEKEKGSVSKRKQHSLKNEDRC